MADEELLDKIQNLSDLELAALLCLTAQEHCVIYTESNILDDLVLELQLIACNVFGLTQTVVDCNEHTTLEDFADSIFADNIVQNRSDSPTRTRQDSHFLQSSALRSASHSSISEGFLEGRKIANVIIAKNLDKAPKQVQIQALELMRTKRIFTHTSFQSAPKTFLLIALLEGAEGPRLTKHLNDYVFISHFHDPEDGFPNLEDLENDGDSISSVIKKKAIHDQMKTASVGILSVSDIAILNSNSANVTVDAEIFRYIHNIISFLRMHRAVRGGIYPIATKQFERLVRYLASLHGMDFVTPTLVALAAKKIYPHRIEIVPPEHERSMQWGSDISALAAALQEVGPVTVIDDVLGMVEVPL